MLSGALVRVAMCIAGKEDGFIFNGAGVRTIVVRCTAATAQVHVFTSRK